MSTSTFYHYYAARRKRNNQARKYLVTDKAAQPAVARQYPGQVKDAAHGFVFEGTANQANNIVRDHRVKVVEYQG